MSAKHTPGSWSYMAKGAFTDDSREVAFTENFQIVNLGIWNSPSVIEEEANARLITAAPELLKAFKVSLIRAYSAGYAAGHHDTVEAQYTDLDRRDVSYYFEKEVESMLADGTLPEAQAAITKAEGTAC